MVEIHPDRNSFETIWSKVIEKEIENYKKVYSGCIELVPNLKEELWKEYENLNSYCKTVYMKSAEDKIDRHKVAACYMMAILALRPMKIVGVLNVKNVPVSVNERLAITVGLSVVRAFAIAAIRVNENISEEEKTCLTNKFLVGMKIPSENLVNHGSYLQNYATELYFASNEGKLCILSLAHELYLLEVITRL